MREKQRKDLNVLSKVKQFYEENNFPSYDGQDSKHCLSQKAKKNVLASYLDKNIPPDASVLEVGCGTGQLSNFLGLSDKRKIFATDISINSLKLGEEFKTKNHIDNVTFLEMNLFNPIFEAKKFDWVICTGVLHHTGNPSEGLQSIVNLIKDDGFVVVGLYNKYGRFFTNVRQVIFKITKCHFMFLDSRLRNKNFSEKKKHIWFMDQYRNPHESKHSFGEVLKWFDSCNLVFVKGFPDFSGTWFSCFLNQMKLLFSGSKDGGFFIMIGQKKMQKRGMNVGESEL